jgi:hypothetical protein
MEAAAKKMDGIEKILYERRCAFLIDPKAVDL